jgi:heavy metal sensor kinase
MINIRSLRFRLAVWYFCTVAAICSVAGVGYWFAIRSALATAQDAGLRYRVLGLRAYLEKVTPATREEIAARLDDIYQIGELYQVFDASEALILQSYGLERHHIPLHVPDHLGSEIRYEPGGTAEFPLRMAWQRMTLGEQTLILNAADPVGKYDGVLGAFTSVVLFSTPIILGLATICGLWLGRRALAPVARVASDARAITESNLSARLAVPESRDELQWLSETLNQMLDRIEQSFTRTKQFTADASHELRAPMTLIHTAAEYSLRRERSREELVEGMQKILRESQRTTALIDDLLLLARGDAGRERPELELVDAVPVLREVADSAMAMAAQKNVRVTAQILAPALPVRADEAKLRRLLLILAHNAVKYTPAGGQVTIAGRADTTEVTLAVTDTGVGIGPDDLPHIFERFWRADKVRSREHGGTGLGLTIARQIAEQHGATLRVHSDIGVGAEFTLQLPLAVF